MVTERLIPARQCTRTPWFRPRASSVIYNINHVFKDACMIIFFDFFTNTSINLNIFKPEFDRVLLHMK